MNTKEKILAWAKRYSPFTSSALVKHLGISRQNVAAHLSALVQQGKLTKSGSTRAAQYSIPSKDTKAVAPPTQEIVLIKKLKGLEEDRVFQELERKLDLRRALNKNALTIASYAFTEMLNNAIDHSHSRTARIDVRLTSKSFKFYIRDFGIGIFDNVKKGFKLKNEFDALEHVFKGKQTTDPKRHSGEGIFFTSRISDRFALRSHRLRATIDNEIEDTFVKEERYLRGTLVEFQIRRHTKKKLTAVFQSFTNADLEFDRNHVRIKLSLEGGLLSRSQAKRLLVGLEKYSRVTLDLQGVLELGQGFADEVFRVFQAAHPKIQLDYINAVQVVDWMIRRVKKGR